MPLKIQSYEDIPDFTEFLKPDFENGKLYWTKRMSPKAGKDDEAGTIHKDLHANKRGRQPKPYMFVNIQTLGQYKRARILYYLKYGLWVPRIDHINGDSLDDRIDNLREISANKNTVNSEYLPKGKTLPRGVWLEKKHSKTYYRVRPRVYGRPISMGMYKDVNQAKEQYEKVLRDYYGKDLTVDYYLDIEQSSPEWHFLRQNRITGTSAYNLLKTENIESVLDKLREQKPFNGNYYTRRGKILESEAREIYAEVNDIKVHEVGAIINSKYPRALSSPDGLVNFDGCIEIKCFKEKRHYEVYKNLDAHIIAQIQFLLFMSERQWCDLVLYNPDLSDLDGAFLVRRIYPDPEIHERFARLLQK